MLYISSDEISLEFRWDLRLGGALVRAILRDIFRIN